MISGLSPLTAHTRIWRALGRLAAVALLAAGVPEAGAAALAQASTDALLLAPAQAEAPPLQQARGVFYRHALAVELPRAQVWLASTADGQGELCTDDQATITIAQPDRPAQRWSHQFASPDRRGIVCIPPLRLLLSQAGAYSVTVVLEDLYPDTYGSRPYYLVFERAAQVAGPSAIGAAGTAQPTPARPTIAGARTPIQPAVGIHPPGASAFPTTPALDGPADRAAGISAGIDWLGPALLGSLALLLAGAGGLLWRRRRRRARPAGLSGVVYLFDQETREARAVTLLGMGAPLAIRRHPLDALPSAALGQASGAIARIALVDGRPALQSDLASTEAAPAPLRHDQIYPLAGGVVTLRYRGPDAARPAHAGRRKG